MYSTPSCVVKSRESLGHSSRDHRIGRGLGDIALSEVCKGQSSRGWRRIYYLHLQSARQLACPIKSQENALGMSRVYMIYSQFSSTDPETPTPCNHILTGKKCLESLDKAWFPFPPCSLCSSHAYPPWWEHDSTWCASVGPLVAQVFLGAMHQVCSANWS